MRFRLEDGERIADRYVLIGLVVSLALGLGLYAVVPGASADEDDTKPAVAVTTTTTPAASGGGGEASSASGSGSSGSSGAFGSAVSALASGTTADEAVAQANRIDTLIPGLSCPTDVVTAAGDDARSRVSDAIGAPVPGSAIGDLAAIAAGCSNADPTGPVLSLAIELTALVGTVQAAPAAVVNAVTTPAASSASAEPSLPGVTVPGASPATTAAPAPTTTVAVTVPATVPAAGLPESLVDALAPVADVIRAGCADVPYVGVAAGAYGATDVQVDGVPVLTAVERATALCALLDA